jgi:hypothetical protein
LQTLKKRLLTTAGGQTFRPKNFTGKEEGLSSEVLGYYYDHLDGTVSASLPAFYYFKQRKREVIDFVMDSVRDKESILMRGDTDDFFKRKMPEAKTSREKLKVFGEIERMFKKTTQTLATNPNEVFDRDLRHMARKSNLERAKSNKVFRNLAKNDQDYCFEMNLASKIRQQKYDVEDFLLKNNFFNRPHEEIQTIFKVMMSTFDFPSSV